MKSYSYNSLPSILNWAANAVRDLPVKLQIQLLKEALDLMAVGNLRGDISEYWIDQYPEYKDRLINLYL